MTEDKKTNAWKTLNDVTLVNACYQTDIVC